MRGVHGANSVLDRDELRPARLDVELGPAEAGQDQGRAAGDRARD